MKMHITTFYDSVEIHREDKVIYAKFLNPHLVLSTCRLNPGIRRDLKYVLNHQACEPTGHDRARKSIKDPKGYAEDVCRPLGIEPDKCAMMSTAANMNNAAIVVEEFEGLEVAAVVTAGVETNAGRAGDPATVMETKEGFLRLPSMEPIRRHPGTINIMLFIGHALSDAALVRSIITATEAKSAALQELNVNSRYSDGLATGTGTDQMVVSSKEAHQGFRLSWAGKHSKLGELIGTTVKSAVKEALKNQNRLTPQGQCSTLRHLERFGIKKEEFLAKITSFLGPREGRLFLDNYKSIDRDPLTVASVASICHVKDKFKWGILPEACWKDIMGASSAQIACAVGGRWDRFAIYRESLGDYASNCDNQSFITLCTRAFALGFQDKWGEKETKGNER